MLIYNFVDNMGCLRYVNVEDFFGYLFVGLIEGSVVVVSVVILGWVNRKLIEVWKFNFNIISIFVLIVVFLVVGNKILLVGCEN